MSDLNPTAPSQPTLNQAYTTPSNPVSKTASESHTASSHPPSGHAIDQRIPPTQSSSTDDATPSSLGRGVRGAGPGEEAKGLSDEDVGRHRELDGEQMAAPGEGRVADAVAGRGGLGGNLGGGGEQPDFVADLDRLLMEGFVYWKKAEQAEAREAIKQQRARGAVDGGDLGQQGGPANPVP
ncbi:hypothetical protein BU24DRAFT_452178 [Aaosphaeria arxii CBS 175.79]|uniref:Uncharacterized protein n=1 Tax=Aaosphaeria arxii CBS 175.79 TaxID=1450172 RepID=A0A6A5XJV4_9PLEO|nr:uncharacterized protein BU24DRAFT_452178 [Aaosphaeria arxii CBS 175.79]KAF2013233.1 hypothetical protein BU24DRAFT_452178 [Aaosphaeria arxii CBS 175.79]